MLGFEGETNFKLKCARSEYDAAFEYWSWWDWMTDKASDELKEVYRYGERYNTITDAWDVFNDAKFALECAERRLIKISDKVKCLEKLCY